MPVEIRQTSAFRRWYEGLRDRTARAKIAVRIDRLTMRHSGDARPVGHGVSELRIDHGPGYRVYFVRRSGEVIVLLAGGDKSSQPRDIARAQALAAEI